MKVNVEYDTVTKKMYLTMDGVPATNVSYLSFCPCDWDDMEENEYRMIVEQMVKDEESDVTVRHSTQAMVASLKSLFNKDK